VELSRQYLQYTDGCYTCQSRSQNMKQIKLQVVKLNSLVPSEPFGKVAKAMEALDTTHANGQYRVQIIELPPNTSFEPHTHISEHVIYAIEGSGNVSIWGYDKQGENIKVYMDSKKVYAFSKGDILIIPKDCPHAFASSDEGLKEVIINIPGIALNDELRIVWM
jgi:quercetin dioxygenase-like cupin family protein